MLVAKKFRLLEYYYPYGLIMPGRSSNTGNPNADYKFTGYEVEDDLGLNLYNASARLYDPIIGRFMQIDPLAEKYPEISPYTYALNTPLILIDPDGREVILGTLYDRVLDFFGFKTNNMQRIESVVDILRSTETGNYLYQELNSRKEKIYLNTSEDIVGCTGNKLVGLTHFTLTSDNDGNLTIMSDFNVTIDVESANKKTTLDSILRVIKVRQLLLVMNLVIFKQS